MPFRTYLRSVVICIPALYFLLSILIFPTETTGGATSGLSLCLYTLIPATFPFVVISAFCVHSGVAELIGKFLAPVCRLLFHLPGCCTAVIALSWLGGYPAGVRSIVSLYHHSSITQAQGQRMLLFCVSAGSSFTITVIGIGIFRSATFGVLLFLSQTAALLLIGVVTGVVDRFRFKNASCTATTQNPQANHTFCSALVLSANDGARCIVSLCSFVILFSVLIEPLNCCGFLRLCSVLLQKIGLSPTSAAAVFPLCWEITSGIRFSSYIGVPLEAIVFFTASGGLCVSCQILAAAAPLKINNLLFLLSRLCHSTLTLLLFLLMKPFFALPEPITNVFHNTGEMLFPAISSSGSGTITSALCGGFLLLICIVFLLCSKNHRLEKIR